MEETRNLGIYEDFDSLWKEYPAGGLAGDYATVDGKEYHWDDIHKRWTDPEEGLARQTMTVDGDLDVFNDLTVGGKIKRNGFDDSYVLLAGGGLIPLADLVIEEEDIDEQTVGKYLSKLKDDVAAGKITFKKGFAALAASFFGHYLRKASGDTTDLGASITPDGTGDFVNLIVRGLVKGGLTVEDLLSIKDMLFTGTIRSKDSQGRTARKGFTDGYGVYIDAEEGLIEADGMNIRGFLRVMELIINRLQLMESDYSFTEGGTVEHVDITSDCERMIFRMHKRHDNDFTPFYYGDIVYAKVNDLLSHGSYYTCWFRVENVNLDDNTLTVVPYLGRDNAGVIVPGGTNFTPKGHAIVTNYTGALEQELEEYPDGYDTQMNITRHGNVADGIDPNTGEVDEHIKKSQQGRQQAWVLSTTDKRMTFFWNVDSPIIREDNYSLCFGILPDLSNLPHDTDGNPMWDVDMPSLYINTVFYENMHHIYYPARIVKEDRGQWAQNPTVIYTGPSGTYTPDGTLDDATITGWAGSYVSGENIMEPYHFEHITRNTWITYRLRSTYKSYSDKVLYDKIMIEWHLDRETSRVWNYGCLWECMSDGTTEEPTWNCSSWRLIGGQSLYQGELTTSNGKTFRNGDVDTILTMRIWHGNEEVTERVKELDDFRITWTRYTSYNAVTDEFEQSSEDLSWTPEVTDTNKIHLTRGDMGSGWMIDYRQALIHCEVRFGIDGQSVEMPADYTF